MVKRKKRNGGDDLELKELERMEEEERNAKAAALPNNTLLPLTPTSDWHDPAKATHNITRARRPATHKKLYPGGTMTGPSWVQGPKTARAEKGKKVSGAQRGVGQPTIDGFINGMKTAKKKRKSKLRRS